MKFASHEPPEVSPFGGDVAARRQRGYLCNPSRRSAPPSLKGRALGSAIRKAANFNAHEYISYQIKSNRALFFCQMLGCIVFCAQFFIMGAYTGAISLIINIVRNVLLLKSNVWKWAKSKVTLYVILLLLAILTAFTWDGWISLLPFASVAVTTFGYWTHNAQKIRLSQLFGSPCTLAYDLIIRTWGGAISEAIAIISILVSIYRFGWKNLADETS